MEAEQSMTQAIIQTRIESAKAAIMAVREVDNLVNNASPVHTAPRSGGPMLKQPTFDWKVAGKYQELCSISCLEATIPAK